MSVLIFILVMAAALSWWLVEFIWLLTALAQRTPDGEERSPSTRPSPPGRSERGPIEIVRRAGELNPQLLK